MKNIIESLHFDEVIVPCHPGVINSVGLDKPLHRQSVAGKKKWSVQFDELPKLLLTMKLSNGVTAIGEFYRNHEWSRIKGAAEILIGQDINQLSLQNLPIGPSREYYGFECAIYDGFAKSKEMRVVDLIGGPMRDRVKVMAWSSHRSVEEIGHVARKYQQEGYDTIKMKADLVDPVVEWCQQIHEHAPNMKVVFDPNTRWENAGNTRHRLKVLEEVGNVLLLEDPIPHWMWHEFADLRKCSSIPIVMHVSPPYTEEGQSIHDAINAIKHGSVDGFNFNAGIASFKELDSVATASGMNFWHGSEIDLGVLEAMFIHNASAAKSCVWPSDIFGRMLREHDLLKTPLTFDPPYAYLPSGHGLGVEIDYDAVEKYKTKELTIKHE
ncbi:mandelate racemase/muconate lactonizing enzyme family protein [Cysteiniphilum halobium]|uniref:mandelate racemase/muconate lactonizing enzyme family protein n=1 Tax=Cysteiniphilum halobium TaxID=2219059 RepID=UPI003F86E9AF